MHLSDFGTQAAMDRVVQANRAWYDREARSYGERTSSFGQFPGLLDEISGFARDLRGLSGPILDLGCGAGRDTEFFLDHGLGVVSADVSTAMLLATTNRCGRDRTRPVQLDMRHLPFRADVFRGVWVCASLVHMPPAGIPGVISELHRTVKTGGQVAISMKHNMNSANTRSTSWATTSDVANGRWFTCVDPDSFERLLREGGFADCRSAFSGRGDWFIAHGTRSELPNRT